MRILGIFYTILAITAQAIGSATRAYVPEFSPSLRVSSLAPCPSQLPAFYAAFPWNMQRLEPQDLAQASVSELFEMKLPCGSSQEMVDTLLDVSERIYPDAVIKPILLDPSFHIVVLPESHPAWPNFGGVSPEGMYLPGSNTLMLKERSGLSKIAAERLLKNEFAHAITRYKNVKTNALVSQDGYFQGKKLTWEDIFLPVLNGQWKVSGEKLNRYQNSIQRGLAEINQFKSVQATPKSKRSSADQKAYQNFNEAIKDYQPQVQKEEVPKAVFQQLRLKKGDSIPGRLGTLNVEEIESLKNGNYLVHTSYATGATQMERIRNSFFHDVMGMVASVEIGAYKEISQKAAIQYAELASWIEELPGAVRRLCFPEWCRYMDEYLEIDSGVYCSM